MSAVPSPPRARAAGATPAVLGNGSNGHGVGAPTLSEVEIPSPRRPDASAESVSSAGPSRTRAITGTTAMGAAGRIITAVGLGLVLFLGFLFGFSRLSEARSQALLTREFQGLIAQGAATAPDWTPAEGQPMTMLSIPALGISKLVAVEGTTPDLLKGGPGHFRTTPLPGQPGNSVYAGRRTTYGSPFSQIDTLQPGDVIQVTTPQGQFDYSVTQHKTVMPGQSDVLGTFEGKNTLTLVTSDPALSVHGRIAVIAQMSGATLPVTDQPTPDALSAGESGLAGDLSALGPLLLWGELLLAAVAIAWVLYVRWDQPRVVWLLTSPVIVALVFLTFMSLDRLLPGTL